MKIENDKIIQATEDELYSYWLTRGWDDVFSFPEYMQRMKNAGCEVIAEIPQKLFDRITESPEVLAEKLVYEESLIKPDGTYVCRYFSTIVDGGCWLNESEAIAATVEKLKEVCDE